MFMFLHACMHTVAVHVFGKRLTFSHVHISPEQNLMKYIVDIQFQYNGIIYISSGASLAELNFCLVAPP